MITFFDLLILVSMVLIAGSLLSLTLMFLVKNQKVRRVCFYAAVVLGLYIDYVGFRINWPEFYGQAVLAAVLGLVSIGAVVLERVRKQDDKMFLAARIAASAALVIGICNALLV